LIILSKIGVTEKISLVEYLNMLLRKTPLFLLITFGFSFITSSALAFVVDLLTPSFITDEKFLSFSYDASQIKGTDNFGFFQSNRVDALISGLSPAYFRFSGTDIDYMLFDENGKCDNSFQHSLDVGFKGCLNSTQVNFLLNITARTNTSLVFGINGFIGKNPTSPNAPWNSTNAATFFTWLQQTLAANKDFSAPVAYELGNEPDLWPQRAQGEVLASDLAIFRNLLSQYPQLNNAFHIGPDPCWCYNGEEILQNYSKALSPALIASSGLHISWHFYNNPKQPSPLGMVNATAGADVLIGKINSARDNIARGGNVAALNAPLVIGETGECAGGGCHAKNGTRDILYSEEFIDSYLRLDKLGLSAAMNVSILMMEKIFGGNDGFISPLSFPLGAYWVHWLHKQLVGPKVLNVVNSTTTGRSLRLYAQCARQVKSVSNNAAPVYPLGSVVLMIVNFDWNVSATITLEDISTGLDISLTPRDEYRLTGSMPDGLPNDDPNCLFGPQPHKLMYLPPPVCVNGELLYLSDGPKGFNTTMPTVSPITITDPSQSLQLPPLGLGFFVLPNAKSNACM
jgi:hypothetical protein